MVALIMKIIDDKVLAKIMKSNENINKWLHKVPLRGTLHSVALDQASCPILGTRMVFNMELGLLTQPAFSKSHPHPQIITKNKFFPSPVKRSLPAG